MKALQQRLSDREIKGTVQQHCHQRQSTRRLQWFQPTAPGSNCIGARSVWHQALPSGDSSSPSHQYNTSNQNHEHASKSPHTNNLTQQSVIQHQPIGPLHNVTKFLDQQCLPVALLLMMFVGATFPAWGQAAAKQGLMRGVTIAIFIIAGLQLRRGEATAALSAVGCVVWGLLSILLITPLVGPLLLQIPVPSQVAPLVLGTAVFCCMPTTLSSGISMTSAAGGNTALAILLTISSNLLGVITLPWLLPSLLGANVGSALQPAALLKQLCLTVLLPTAAGATARAFIPGVAKAIDSNKRPVVWASAACLSVVPWMQVSQAVGAGLSVPIPHLLLAAGLGAAAHIAFLVLNAVCVWVLNLGGSQPLPRAQLRQALVLQASQKTLPVAVAVLAEGPLAAQLGAVGSGLAAISAVAAHLAQVLIDSLLVGVWSSYIQQAKQEEEGMTAVKLS